MTDVPEKIKVCFFSPGSYAYFRNQFIGVYGGAELQMYLLSRQLSKNKHFGVSVIVGNYGQDKIEYHDKTMLIKGFTLPQYESAGTKLIKAIKYFFLLKKYKPDIIITTSFNSIIGLTALYKKILGIKHIHRTASKADVDLTRVKENVFLGKIFDYGLKNANAVVVQNEEYARLLKENYSISPVVLKNAIALQNLKENNKSGVLWVGRLNKVKRPELFIELARTIPSKYFTMICPYSEEDIKNWNDMKNKTEKLLNIRLIEKVEYSEIQKYFNEAEVLINTSFTEGFPNTFLQAAQGKTPIISLNVNPDNFLNEYNCGIFCETNFQIMVKKTKELLNNEDELKIKGKNAYKYLKKNHDINIVGKQLEKIIYDIL